MLTTVIKNDHVKMMNRKSIKTDQTKITITVRDGSWWKSESKNIIKRGEYRKSFLLYHGVPKKREPKIKEKKFQ